MLAVALMLDWLDERGIDPAERVGTGDLLSNEEIYALRHHLRKKVGGGEVVVGSQHWRNRCISVRDYFAWHAEMVISRIPNKEWQRAQAYRQRLDQFKSQMSHGLPSSKSPNREGHSEEVQAIFLEAIAPDSLNNPFKGKFRKRNYALLLLYHELGPRRGEALKLRGEDLSLQGDEPFIRITINHDDPSDPRVDEPRMKTQPRTLPISHALRDALRDWIMERGRVFKLAKRTAYVFVAGTGRPLGLGAVNDTFKLLRERVDGLPSNLTTHHKRNDANDRFTKLAKKLGWDEAETKRNRNYVFGWAKTSNQGDQYTARATREGAAEASRAHQEKMLREANL